MKSASTKSALFRAWAAAALVLGAIGSPAITQAQAASPTKIEMGFTATAEPVIVFSAQDDKFLEKYKVDVNPRMISSGSAIVAALVAGSLQVGSMPPTVMLQAIDGGVDLVLICGEAVSAPDVKSSAIVVRNGADIKGPADLLGRRVAVSGVTSISHILARRWLTMNKLDPAKVQFVEIPFSNHADAIRSGTVDAAVTADPVISRVVAAGAGSVLHYMQSDMPPGVPMISLVSTRQWAQEHPAAVAALRAGLAESRTFLQANPTRATALYEKYLRLSPAVAQATEMPNLDTTLEPGKVQWWIDLMKAQGMLSAKIDAARVMAP